MGFFGGGSSVDLASPPAIGSTTPNTGAFTTLSANNGTLTSSSPAFTLAQTWNNAGVVFTALRANVTDTASNSASLLIDLQLGGSSRFSVDKTGSIVSNYGINIGGTSASSPLLVSSTFYLATSTVVQWGTAANRLVTDLAILKEAANVLSQRNGTNAQTFRLYNTFTDASNYERGIFSWSSNVLEIGSECAGTGATRTTRLVAQDKAGGYSPVVELAFKPNNTLSKRLSFTNNSGAFIQWGIDGTFFGHFTGEGFSCGTRAMGFSQSSVHGLDAYLIRDDANIIAQRNSTNAQTFRLYRTYTDASNYERLGFLATNTTRYTITSQNAGTGSARSLEVSFYTSASDPTSTDITNGCFSVWKNSGTGTIKLWANDGGTMKSVALA